MNEAYVRELQQTIDGEGRRHVAFITRAYQIEWPQRPYPAHLVAYANFGGAYSFTGKLMILASNRNAANDHLYPLESVFSRGDASVG